MSPSPSPLFPILRNLGLLALAGGLGYWAYGALGKVAKTDPFSALRPRETKGLDGDALVQMKGVRVRNYDKGKLAMSAQADSLTMNKDRVNLRMQGVRNGLVQTKRGPVKFAAKAGQWNGVTRRLEMTGGGRMAGQGFDLQSEVLTYDQNQRLLSIPEAKGKLGRGVARVQDFQLHTGSEAYRTGSVRYLGQVPGQETPTGKDATWDLQADNVTGTSNGRFQTGLVATATDGEILLKAPKVVWDKERDVVVATGRVFYYSQKANAVADEITVYRKEKRAVLKGNVFLLVKKDEESPAYKPQEEPFPAFKPMAPDDVKAPPRRADQNGPTPEEKKLDDALRNGKTVRDYPLVVTGAEGEYLYEQGKRRGKLTGDPQARQELPGERWRHLWTDVALYDGEKETLRGNSAPGQRSTRLKTSIGDDFTAVWIQVSTKEDDDSFEGQNVKGTTPAERKRTEAKGGG